MQFRYFFKYVTFALLVALTAESYAQQENSKKTAAPLQPALKVTWMSDHTMMLCRMDQPIARYCFTKELPKQVGLVTRTIQGKFVLGVRASWIVIADKKLSLCALATELGKIGCRLMINDPDDSRVNITYVNGQFYFAEGRGETVNTSEYAAVFTDSLSKATAFLSTKVKRDKKSTVSRSIGGDPQMQPSLVDDGGGCYYDDEGSGDCSDSGGGGGGGGGGEPDPGSGSSGDSPIVPAGWTCTTNGLVTICTSGPPPADPYDPPPPPAPSPDLSLCGLFGWFCPPPPQPAPTPAPILSEAERYRAVKDQCIASCSSTELPTPPGNDGWNFYQCLNDCMAANGYPNG